MRLKNTITVIFLALFCMQSHAQSAGEVIGDLANTATQVATEQVIPLEVRDQSALGKFIENLKEMWKQTDIQGNTLQELWDSKDYMRAMYEGAKMVKSAPLLDDVVVTMNDYIASYNNLMAYYSSKLSSPRSLNSFHDVSRMMRDAEEMSLMTKKLYEDFDFIFSYVFNPINWKGTEMQRYDLLKDLSNRLTTKKVMLEMTITTELADDDEVDFTETLDALMGRLDTSMDVSTLPYDLQYISNLNKATQKDYDEAAKSVLNSIDNGDTKAIENASRKVHSLRKTAINLGMVCVILLTAAYVPYNLWKLSTGEMQTKDAFIRIVLGLMVGFLALLFWFLIF